MEIGVYSFGDTPRNSDGSLRPTWEAISNLFEAITHADFHGVDYFGVGEHHTVEMPASSPAAMVAAAAGSTSQIILGSAVSVLSTDDPVRMFQQFATADAVSGGGRVEITAGRGSSVDSFPLFGYSISDYDELYADKLNLLMKLNLSEKITWSGTMRPSLKDALVVPRPAHGRLPIWLGSGGSAPSSARAGTLGLPIAYGIIGGFPSQFAPLAELYRASARRAGHTGRDIRVSVGSFGFIADTTEEAVEAWYPYWAGAMRMMSQSRGGPGPSRDSYQRQVSGPGAFFVGGPQDVADRIVELHRHLGHSRHFFQMDLAGLPHDQYLRAIELLGSEVAPRVEKALHD